MARGDADLRRELARRARQAQLQAVDKRTKVIILGKEIIGFEQLNDTAFYTAANYEAQYQEQETAMNNNDLKELLEQCKQKIEEQQAFIDAITKAATPLGTLLDKDEARGVAVLLAGSSPVEIELTDIVKKLPIGSTVQVVAESMQVKGASPFLAGGVTCTVRDIRGELLGIEDAGRVRYIRSALDKVEPGDRVLVDLSGHVALRNYGKEKSSYVFEAETNVSWDEIAGLGHAKLELRESIELPKQHPGLFKAYGKKQTRGILLYGPPGCGKTMLAKAAATAVAEGKGGFFHLKGPEILDKWVGESEGKIRGVFQAARAFKAETGRDALIFIDEAEAILGRRGSGRSSDMEKTIVPMFLAEMDGLGSQAAMVILATNRQDTLDSAVVRDGRIDKKIMVTRPSRDEASDIAELYLKHRPIHKSSPEELAERVATDLFSGKHPLFKISMKSGNKARLFGLQDICSGALIAGIVETATAIAMRRDIGLGKVLGLQADDIASAIAGARIQNRDLSHQEALEDFVAPFREDVAAIQRVA